MILGKGLRSENYWQKKNFKLGLTKSFFGTRESFGAEEFNFSNSFCYFSDPVKNGWQD
jgi:hypothetical protein